MCCPTGQTNCSGTCIDTKTNVANCGGCGTTCTTPTDKCHVAQGASCSNGACSYPAKSCVVVDCYSTPSCDLNSGDCVSTPLTGGVCGGNACYVNGSSGTCNNGVCVDGSGVPLQTTNCSTTVACKVGVCDHTGACTMRDAADGTSCASELCIVGGVCQGGTCTGTPKCTPMDDCHEVSCDSTSGSCTQSPSAKGKSCSLANECKQNGACDGAGTCVGTDVPDGTTCASLPDCAAAGCMAGECTCMDQTSSGDMSVDAPTPPKPADKGGCSFAPTGSPMSSGVFCFVLLGVLALLRRRRAD